MPILEWKQLHNTFLNDNGCKTVCLVSNYISGCKEKYKVCLRNMDGSEFTNTWTFLFVCDALLAFSKMSECYLCKGATQLKRGKKDKP